MTPRLRRVEIDSLEVPVVSTPPVALTIAGTDSGGGAGIAADIRTFAEHGVFGTFAVTALTAQDTTKVHGVVVTSSDFLDLQLEAVLGDFEVAAAKTGMLANVALIDLLTSRANEGRLPTLVVDPVMVATSGSSLIEGDAPRAYRNLIAKAAVVTPNLPEAEALLDRELSRVEDMIEAAQELVELGAQMAVVKGGHLGDDRAVDVVYDGNEVLLLDDEMIETANLHGTGCTLSAAIAANLALGKAPLSAVIDAKRFVASLIRASAGLRLGHGPGPLDHTALRSKRTERLTRP